MKLKIFAVLLILNFSTACVTSTVENSSVPNEKRMSQDDKALIHTQLAQSYLEKKQYSVAKQSLEKALSISPNHSNSNYVMGLLMLELEQHDKAESYLKTAVETNTENSSAAHDLGMVLCQRNKQQESIEYFRLAARNPLFNKPELSYMRAGECLSQLDKDKEATEYLKKALNINPALRPALIRLSKIQYDNESYFSARAYIERYFAITKPQPGALLLGFQIESALNSSEAATKYKKSLLEGFPGSKAAKVLRKMLGDNGG